jgi:hypothetical protein
MGCIFILKISKYFMENIKLYKVLAWLEKYQFIVYAIHGIIIPQLLKIYIKIIPINDGGTSIKEAPLKRVYRMLRSLLYGISYI